jgi:hypothetical protein
VTRVCIKETAGRLYISFVGPDARTLGHALRASFAGHRTLYRTRAGAYRLWARDRERLGVWLEVWAQPGQVTWTGEAAGLRPGLPNEQAR